jgi:hypothetical protein
VLTATAAAALFLSLEPPTRPVRVYAAQRKPVASGRSSRSAGELEGGIVSAAALVH